MYCKDCKYLKKGLFCNDGFVENLEIDRGYCFNEKIQSDYVDGWLGRENLPSEPLDGIIATCDEGRGELIVGELFGCIHFESLNVGIIDVEKFGFEQDECLIKNCKKYIKKHPKNEDLLLLLFVNMGHFNLEMVRLSDGWSRKTAMDYNVSNQSEFDFLILKGKHRDFFN